MKPITLSALVLSLALSLALAAPAPREKPQPPGGVVVLDDSDPEYKGKATYDDGLTFFAASGKVRKRVSGLNVCQEIGSPNRVTIDASRKRVWVAETVGQRLLCYDLDGKELLAVPDVKAMALAVDPATGNVWAACCAGGIGSGWVEVFSPAGKSLAKHKRSAYDLAYDPTSKSVWAVEKKLVKFSLAGKALVEKPVADWCAVSVAVDGKSGRVWVAARGHSKDVGKNQLLCFDNAGKALHEIDLPDETVPFRVAVDPRDGSAWVVNVRRALWHYDAKGKRVAEHKIAAISVAVNPANGRLLVVTESELLDVDTTGKVVGRTALRAKTLQAWVASY